MKSSAPTVLAVATLAVLGFSAIPVVATAEGLPPIRYTFGDGTVIRFSGHVNMGVLNYDDGEDDNAYFVDNDNSSSRARIQLFSKAGDWKFKSHFEVEYQPLASDEVSQLNDTPDWNFYQRYIRKAEVAFANERLGKLWLGRRYRRSRPVGNYRRRLFRHCRYGRGQCFRFEGGNLSDIQISDAFANFDGLSKKVRARYDAPILHGFGLRVSYGVDWLAEEPEAMYDIAATYSGDFETFALEGAVSMSHNGGATLTSSPPRSPGCTSQPDSV